MSGIRPIWWLRAVVVTVVIVYFALPYSVSGWIPVWLPFLLAVVTEAQFFVSGWRSTPRRERVDPGPLVSDLEELGRGSLLSVPLRQGGELWLESGEFTDPRSLNGCAGTRSSWRRFLPAVLQPGRSGSTATTRSALSPRLRRHRQLRHVAAASEYWCRF